MEARDEKRLLRLQKQLAKYSLLVIDELGFVPLSKTGAELLFEVFSQRYERGATLVTANLPFDEWIHRRLAAICLGRSPPVQRQVRPLKVVKADPITDQAPGGEAVGDLVEIDLQASAIRPGDIVLEPSAGTGMLAVMAECALGKRTDDARSGDPLHLNEIAAVRAGLLAGLFQDAPVTRHNAEFHRRLSAGPASHCGVDEPAVFGEPRGPAHPP